MRKTQFIPKICAAVILLIAAFALLIPVFPVTLNRIFSGGVIDISTAETAQYAKNRPIEGPLAIIYGCLGEDGDGDVFVSYYLVAANGKVLEKNDKPVYVLLKVKGGTDISEKLNQLYRHNDGIGLSLSGVVRESGDSDKEAAKKLIKQVDKENAKCIDYYIDCNKPVSSYTARTILGLLLLAGAVFAGTLSWKAIKRNRDVDDMEYRRAMMLAEKERREKQGSANSADAIFGDADRSYAQENTQHQGSGQSPTEVARSLEQQSKENNYRPVQNQNNNYDDDGFFSSTSNATSNNEGFYSGGFYGGTQTQMQNQRSGYNNDDGFYSGSSEDSDNKYDGFFGS